MRANHTDPGYKAPQSEIAPIASPKDCWTRPSQPNSRSNGNHAFCVEEKITNQTSYSFCSFSSLSPIIVLPCRRRSCCCCSWRWYLTTHRCVKTNDCRTQGSTAAAATVDAADDAVDDDAIGFMKRLFDGDGDGGSNCYSGSDYHPPRQQRRLHELVPD